MMCRSLMYHRTAPLRRGLH